MAKQSRRGKNELDAILEQLKKSYGSDSSEMLEDDLLEDPKSEEDEELSAILGKIFGDSVDKTSKTQEITSDSLLNENTDEQDTPIEEEVSEEVVETSIVEDNSATEDISEETGDEDVTEAEPYGEAADESEVKDEPAEAEVIEKAPSEDENEDLAAVDSILNLMFSGKPSSVDAAPVDKNAISDIINAENEDINNDVEASSVEEFVSEYQSDPFENNESEEILAEETLDDEIQENEVEEDEFEEDEAFVGEDTIEVESVCTDNELGDESVGEESFAVVDEEYSLDKYYDTKLEDLYETFEKAFNREDKEQDENISEEPEPEIFVPKLILSPSEYTHDPLQEGFKGFVSVNLPKALVEKYDEEKSEKVLLKSEIEAKEETFDENDISLLLKFGYDSEIKSSVGEKKTQKVLLDKDKDFVPDPYKKIYGFCGKELDDRLQMPEIKEKYKINQRNLIILLSVVSILALFIFALNLSFEFSSNKVAAFPFFVLIEFSLILTMMTVLYKKLLAGINKLIKLEISPNTLLCFVTLAYVVYTFVSLTAYLINANSLRSEDLIMFGLAISVYAIVSLVADLLNCIRERKTFNLIADNEEFYTAENQDSVISKKKAQERKNADDQTSTYMIRKTKLISGYFRKTLGSNTIPVKPIYLLGIAPVISFVIGCSVFFVSGRFMSALGICMLTMLLCIPIPYILTTPLIDFVLSKVFKEKKVAYIGMEESEKISKATSVVFSDLDAVEIVSFTEIRPDKTSSTEEYLKIAYQILDTLGGPISNICPPSIKGDDSHSRELIINKISDNGIDLYFNSSVNVLIGDKQFMKLHNIRVKTDSSLLTATKGNEASVIFMAFDGVPRLGFIFNSVIKPEFMKISDLLTSSGVKVSVKTYEPQINDLFFEQNKGHSTSNITVIKPHRYERAHSLDICDGAIVSTDALDLAEAVCISSDIAKFRRLNKRINTFIVVWSIIVSCAIAAFVSIDFFGAGLFGVLRSHLTGVFNVLMIANLIPAIIEIILILKNNKPSK